MTYRMTIRSNPKLLIVPAVIVVLFGCALAAFAVGPALGIIGLVVAAYLSFILARFVQKQLRCAVEVREEGFSLDLYGEEKVKIVWEQVSHLGTAREQRGRRVLFLYREDEDKLLQVPDEFERFDELVAEVAPHGQMMEIELEQDETLKDRLRSIVGGEDPEPNPPESSTPRPSP